VPMGSAGCVYPRMHPTRLLVGTFSAVVMLAKSGRRGGRHAARAGRGHFAPLSARRAESDAAAAVAHDVGLQLQSSCSERMRRDAELL